MPTPVFGGGSQAVSGVLKAENVKLTGWGGPGAIVQQVQVSFERTMNMLYEIGSQNVYFVGDRRRGTIQAQRIVGGSANFGALISKYGEMCNASTNTLKLDATQDGCVGMKGAVKYTAEGVVLTSVGASVTAQDIVITESLGFQFVELQYEAPGGGVGAGAI